MAWERGREALPEVLPMNDDARNDFGPLLRHAREKRGLSLQQVAATTKISARVLEALERNDISKLPGGIFSRSFVRAYAREVGLDPEDTVARFVDAFPADTEEQAPAAATHAVDAESFESGRRTAITLLQILGISVLIVIAVAVYRSMRPVPEAAPAARPTATAEPAQPAGSATQPVTTPAPIPTSLAAGTSPFETTPAAASGTSPGGGTPATGSPGAPGSPGAAPSTTALPPSTLPAPTPVPPAQAAADNAVPTPQTPLSLSVLASEECWLSLSVDGQRVVARNLQPGERVQFRARNAIVLSAGNAGALALTVNGKPGRTLGGRGDVVTTTITVDNAKNFIQ